MEVNTEKEENYLGEAPLGKLILKFAIPSVLSLLVSALYNIVDQIFIGNSSVGTLGNTATTIVFLLTVIALAFGLMLGDGAAAYMPLALGKGEKRENSKNHWCFPLTFLNRIPYFLWDLFPLV